MQHDGIDAVAHGMRAAFVLDHRVEDAPHFALGCFDARNIAGRDVHVQSLGWRDVFHRVELRDQRAGAARLDGDRFDHRYAELLAQFFHVDDEAALLRDVHHVEDQHGGTLQPRHFQHQAEVEAQIGGVGHQHDDVRHARIAATAEEHVAGNRFVRRHRVEAVRAGQIDDLIGASRGGTEVTFLALDGDAGVVGDFLAGPGEAVEESSLAAVRIADQRKPQRRIELHHTVRLRSRRRARH